MEAFEAEGIFWKPDNPDRQVGGTLRFSPEEGLELALIGTLTDEPPGGSPIQLPVIHGMLSGKGFVTLVDAWQHRWSIGPFASEAYQADLGLVGATIATPRQTRFRRLTVRLSHLPSLLPSLRPHFTFTADEARRVTGYTVAIPTSSREQAELPWGVLAATLGYRITVDIEKGPGLDWDPLIDVTLHQPMTLEELYDEVVRPLRDLVTFATLQRARVLSLVVVSDEHTTPVGREQKPQPITVLWRQDVNPALKNRVRLRNPLIRLSRPDCPFERVVPRWFAIYRELEAPLQAYLDILHDAPRPLRQRFLTILQALERYHRTRFPAHLVPADVHEQVVNVIRSALPRLVPSDRMPSKEHEQAYLDRLARAIDYAHEPSLKQRLRQLLDRLDSLSEPIALPLRQQLQRIVDTRNYFAHGDERLRPRAATGLDLWRLTNALQWMMAILLLAELDLDASRIRALLEQNHAYQDVRVELDRVGTGA